MSFIEMCRFNPKKASCLGAEVEYWTMDIEGTRFKIVTPRLFLAKNPVVPDEHVLKPELPSIQIEAITQVCRTPREIECDLASSRAYLDMLGRSYGFSVDTYPTPRFPFKVRVFPKVRYQEIRRRVPAERLRAGWITGLHGHFGCSSLDEAIQLLNGLRPLMPLFVALSARSPEYMGERNGYASERMKMYMTIQRELIPPFIESSAHLESLACERGFDDDPGSCWWGVRINPRHGTVEVRLMDMQETPEHAAQFIALLSVLCRQILSGHRSADDRTSADMITRAIDDAARDPSQQGIYARELATLVRYAESVGLACEHEYLAALYDRLFAYHGLLT